VTTRSVVLIGDIHGQLAKAQKACHTQRDRACANESRRAQLRGTAAVTSRAPFALPHPPNAIRPGPTTLSAQLWANLSSVVPDFANAKAAPNMLSLAPRPVGRAACGVLPRACSPTRRFRCSPPHKVLFLGDFVDRGPDSRGVLEWLSNLPAAMPGQARLPRARAPLGSPRVRPLLQQRSAAKAGRRFRAQPRQRANPTRTHLKARQPNPTSGADLLGGQPRLC